jgi:serpin B
MHRPHLDFVLALHRQLPAEGNLCWSPYSVAAALGLAAAGAGGATRDQLAAALAPGGDLPGLVRMLAESVSLPAAELAVANTLWIDQRLRVRDTYQQAVLDLPGGAWHIVDFQHDPDGSRVKINDEVERTTRGLIKDLLSQGMISPETASVIVNALYLKVAWLTAFEPAATAPAAFQAPSGTRQVPTMRQTESLRYAAAGGWRMVSLPTAGQVMVDVLLPDRVGLPLTAEVVAGLRAASRPTKVELTLPRFRVEHAAVLNHPLQRLGVTAGFRRSEADFSGITTDERIFIDLVVHKAVLRVDEQGFEGAAATAVVMRMVSVDLTTPVPFHVDRPFLVLIRHPRTGAVYFVARVTEP